ncbi:MAG: M17 family metallopeptidase, partial [Candidatus Diapherotrites archaeon]|nr:M17 family metallopeptidase [Candidatus Diapherotrites archaeon]
AELKKMGMGGILGVSAGSHEPSCLVQLEYAPAKYSKTVALVGKGVTFDSGGLNLKPWEGMLTMKEDMAGAATVLGTIIAAAKLRLNARIIAIFPLLENMPGNRAYKDGDILTTFNRKTIEVIHTDAEGRIVLADALAYAESLKPDCIVDLATLTGAQNVALGRYFIGAMGNNPELLQQILAAGNDTFERGWELPLIPEWDEQIRSDAADVRNISKTKGEAGTLIGGAFLRQFVDHTPWAHLDIASVAFAEVPDTGRPYLPAYGGTGVGVRLLVEWIRKMH